MTFDPVWNWFTPVSTLVVVWVAAALGTGCFLVARRVLAAPGSHSAKATFGAGLLLFVSVVSWFVVMGWIFNRHG